jgi:Alternative complex III, ActD subunit
VRSIYGLYSDPDTAQRAVDRLRGAGATDPAIVVISSEPFEEYEFSHRDHETWMFWIAGGGGATGFAFAYWLTSVTQQLWPLNTAGMPIVSGIPNAIVIFETTMLGAILATVITLLISARLPTRQEHMYDPEVSDGYILVGIENPEESNLDAYHAALEAAGQGRVKRVTD